MTNMNLFHALMMILLIIITILDVVTRGTPITLANITPLNLGFIITIILYILDIATKGKYRTRRVALMTFAIGLILSTIHALSYS